MQKITPFLWFNGQAEEAARFYASIFERSKLTSIVRFTEAGPGPKGSVLTASFQLDGQEFVALNGGPEFSFTPAISFAVNCPTQAEIDRLWEALSAGGEKGECGWLKDKFGVSWQIAPAVLEGMLRDPDRRKAERVTDAFLKMKKFDIAELEKAYRG